MLKLVSISIAALAASSAYAQMADPTAPSPAPAPVQGQPGTADPAAPAQPASPGAPGAAAASNPVAAVVDSGFATYDKDSSGSLSAPEFKQWIADLKTQEMTSEGKAADPAAAKTYAGNAWKVADKDKDGKVSKDELTAFLSG